MSYGGRIAILSDQSKAEEFSTIVHELAHEMLHKAAGRGQLNPLLPVADRDVKVRILDIGILAVPASFHESATPC